MKINIVKIRKFHRFLAPIMILPILLTVTTGVIWQIAELIGAQNDFIWAIHWHKGDFGILDFQKSYPFLNALGLLFLTITGFSMWWKSLRRTKPRS